MKLISRILTGTGFSKSPFEVLAVLCLALAPAVTFAEEDAQDGDEISSQELAPEDESAARIAAGPAIEEVVVTGSRLRRDTFSSIAPLQIITGEISREAGLMDAADILQESSVASGQQIDLTFQGFVLDNGPGASTINLRGLAASRTLVLVNGRRLAPSGVEGAPTSPDLNLIPASLVQQYELLLDGASSIYGSDAVAGVANILLKKDFDGFDFESYSNVPYHGAGDNHTLSATWGKNFDRGFVGVGAEYSDSEAVTLADRPWTEDCSKHAEIDENGRLRTRDLYYSTVLGMEWDECTVGLLARGVQTLTASGSIYYTPGTSNGGWPNFSEPVSAYGPFGVDGDGDGQTDISYRDYSLNGREHFAHLFPELKQTSLMAYGEYTLEGEMNVTPYFEILWSERDFVSNSGAGQFFPWVPANNPFNICNPAAEGGVDCGLAEDALLTNPNYVRGFSAHYTALNGCFGLPPQYCSPASFGLLNGPIGAARTRPIVSVRGDRNIAKVVIDHLRWVGGASADLPFLSVASMRDWSMDFSVSFSKSKGSSSREGIRDDRTQLALGAYSTTNTPCENDTGAQLADDTAPGCVPVNMFAPSLYPETIVGDFATQAERDYLFDSRDFDTEYEQTLVSFFASGDVYELPGGAVAAGIGLEWRKDKIRSIPDHVARDGLFFGYFSDGGAEGDKVTKEAFAEVELPIIAGLTLAQELTLNLSARLTDDEYYGTAWTESFKLAYRPLNSLLLRATYGSSYRAPNLRELFLRNQTGFLGIFDPCLIPEDAYDALSRTYNPENDRREAYVLENCRANGIEPTDPGQAWNRGFNAYSTEVSANGSLDLEEETSRSQTVGFAWEQPFTNEFDLAVSGTLYDIEIKNSIVEASAQFVVNSCYYARTGVSPWCDQISRSNARIPLFNIIDQNSLNLTAQSVKGVDINATFTDTYTVFGRPYNLLVDMAAHRLLERTSFYDDGDGDPNFSQFEGEWYYPYWKFQLGVRLEYDKWRLSWQANYIDGQKSDPEFVDDFDDISGNSDTCLGPPDDVLCKDLDWTPDYMVHSLSLFHYADWWTVGIGVRNMFDEEPPFVNEGATLYSNAPIGAGYSINGRTFFLNLQMSFGGGE